MKTNNKIDKFKCSQESTVKLKNYLIQKSKQRPIGLLKRLDVEVRITDLSGYWEITISISYSAPMTVHTQNIILITPSVFEEECINIVEFAVIQVYDEIRLAKDFFKNFEKLNRVYIGFWSPVFNDYGLNNITSFKCEGLYLQESSKDVFNNMESLEELYINGSINIAEDIVDYNIFKLNSNLKKLVLSQKNRNKKDKFFNYNFFKK